MNDFDRFLELQLRQMLDPVVASQPPARRGRLGRILAHEKATVELPVQSMAGVEPVAVTVPIAIVHQL